MRSSNTNIFLAFLDASKAFDRVRHDKLFTKLTSAGVPLYIVRILNVLYSNQSLFAKWNGHISVAFSCSNGVRQGGLISPHLFNFYFDELSDTLNNINIGCCLNVLVNHLFYADDLVLISPTKKGLQKLINECETFSSANSIQFNNKKSKAMIIRSKNYKLFDFGQLNLNGVALEVVPTFKYLGHVINDDSDDHNDVMRHCRYLYAVGNSLIRKFYFCSVGIKLKLFMTYCSNIYTGHLWSNYKSSYLQKAKVAYNSILRKLLHIPRVENGISYSAKAMFAKYNIPSFEATIRKAINSFILRVTHSNHTFLSYLSSATNRMTSEWWKHSLSSVYNIYR